MACCDNTLPHVFEFRCFTLGLHVPYMSCISKVKAYFLLGSIKPCQIFMSKNVELLNINRPKTCLREKLAGKLKQVKMDDF